MRKTTPTSIDITTRTGRRPVHAYLSDTAADEFSDTADDHGITVTAILEALAPRLNQILADDPGIVTDARRIGSARRKRNDR